MIRFTKRMLYVTIESLITNTRILPFKAYSSFDEFVGKKQVERTARWRNVTAPIFVSIQA
jgi:hypothetical protein